MALELEHLNVLSVKGVELLVFLDFGENVRVVHGQLYQLLHYQFPTLVKVKNTNRTLTHPTTDNEGPGVVDLDLVFYELSGLAYITSIRLETEVQVVEGFLKVLVY